MPLLVVYNPICGNGSARAFFRAHVLPLLEKHGKFIDKLACTDRTGHAADIALDFLKSTEGRITIVLGSGDGTLQEIVDVISSHGSRSFPREIQFVLVPCGTANALYSSFFHASDQNKLNDVEYKLRSVRSFIGDAKPIPLNIAITTLSSPPPAPKVPVVIISVVVVSTSLHAAILHDSENLRAEMPGLDRFKVAAHRNASRWYNGSVKLLPATSAGVVQVYSPSLKNFVTYGGSTETIPIVTLEGPFIYFLSTVNVDRLEYLFRISPLASRIPPTEPSLDLVIVRPGRDPMFAANVYDANGRHLFEKKIYAVFQKAYEDGIHIDMRYREDGEIVSDSDGPSVIEYVRCGGWEWIPDENDVDAHRLCTDGAISFIERGGKATCLAANGRGLTVHV